MSAETEGLGVAFSAGDIAFAHLKPCVLQGKTYIVPQPCHGSSEFIRLHTAEISEELRLLIWVYLKIPPVVRHLANKCTGKSESQKRVGEDNLASLPFPRFAESQVTSIASAMRDRIAAIQELEKRAYRITKSAEDVISQAKADIFDMLDEAKYNALIQNADGLLQETA